MLRALVLQGWRRGARWSTAPRSSGRVPECRSATLLRVLVALQTLLNFLDMALETRRPSARATAPLDVAGRVRARYRRTAAPADIIDNELGDDGGYFGALIATCRDGCRQLPSYAAARDVLLREARRAVSFEIEHERTGSTVA